MTNAALVWDGLAFLVVADFGPDVFLYPAFSCLMFGSILSNILFVHVGLTFDYSSPKKNDGATMMRSIDSITSTSAHLDVIASPISETYRLDATVSCPRNGSARSNNGFAKMTVSAPVIFFISSRRWSVRVKWRN